MKKNENKKSAVILRAERIVSARQDLFDKCRNCFNISAKTSENCNKLSKSVSYETLVVGTTTIGTTYKQTQSLSKCSSSYRFYKTMRFSYENLVEILLQTSPFFRFVKIFTIAVILSLVTIGESWAEIISCVNGKYADETACEKCGNNCNWSFDTSSGKLSVSGSGNMYDYDIEDIDGVYYTTAPWGEYKSKVKSLEVSGVNNIGKNSFARLDKISDIKLDDSVRSIKSSAFAWNYSEINSLVLPDSLVTAGRDAFRTNKIKSISIPATIQTIDKGFLGSDKDIIENMEIVCMGTKEDCQNLQAMLSEYQHSSLNREDESLNLSGNVRLADFDNCHTTNYFWDGANCVREPDVTKRKCCDSCKDMGGYCNRIRYTPAEAAQYLKDTDNEIIMTFKVNR